MGAISLEDVRRGMVLERDVVIPPDRLLLASGAELTDAHLALFRAWGVVEVEVRGVSRRDVLEGLAEHVAPERRRALEAEVADLFRHANQGHPAIDELMYQATLRRLRRETERDDHPG